MDAAVAGLLGAAIGALAGVIGSVLTARQQNRAERERRRAAQLDESLKTLLPQLVVAQAAAAAVTDEAFERIGPLVVKLTILDTKIGTAAARFDEDEDGARRRLAETKGEALSLGDDTLVEVRAALRSLERF